MSNVTVVKGAGLVVTDPARDRFLGMCGIGLAAIGLSSGSTLVRLSGSPGPVVAFWRLALGAVVWQFIVRIRGQRFGRQELLSTLLPGVCFGVNLTMFFVGVTKTRVANAEFIGTLSPFLVVPLSVRQLGERVPVRILGAAAIALTGIAMILFFADRKNAGNHSLVGDAFCLCAVVLWSAYLFTSRAARKTLSVDVFMAGMTLAATVVVLPVAVSTHRLFDATAKGWVIFVVIALVNGVIAHGLIAWAQKAVPLSTLSMMQLSQPVFAVAWSWLLLSEGVNGMQIIGMIVVLGAVAMVARLSTNNRARPGVAAESAKEIR
jgi:drug/metabolite transporter (DMT)-like permease